MFKDRYLHENIKSDLRRKMVFIGGPRQVGKTTLSKILGKDNYPSLMYLNWDSRENRKVIFEEKFDPDSKLLIFDEIHKYKNWKNYLKGLYDTQKEKFDILITGSARLDVYRKGGDSLMGRYHYYRLHPFSLAEILGKKNVFTIGKELMIKDSSSMEALKRLIKFGGFPEPYIAKDEKVLRRFHNERADRLVKEGIRDIENIKNVSLMGILADLLPSKVGSLFSLNSLKEDLQVTHKTISFWADILERFYYHSRVYPYSAASIKSLRKEPKLYLWDWSQVEDESARFENLVASHLLMLVHYLYDALGHKAELYYLRDADGREVDFLVAIDKQPWFLVEVKLNDAEPAKHLKYFSSKLQTALNYQVVLKENEDFLQGNIRVISANKFLSAIV